jgi:putative transposase
LPIHAGLHSSQHDESETRRFGKRYSIRPNPIPLYFAIWAGFVYIAFIIDAYAWRIVGWRVNRTAHRGCVLDALEQELYERRPARGGGLVHHSDRGVQYVSIKYTERLAEAGIEGSVGSVGDFYDNAVVETINGLYKADVIHRRGPTRSFEAVECATVEWADWFNNRRLLKPIGNIPPAKAEQTTLHHAGTAGDGSVSQTKRPPAIPVQNGPASEEPMSMPRISRWPFELTPTAAQVSWLRSVYFVDFLFDSSRAASTRRLSLLRMFALICSTSS